MKSWLRPIIKQIDNDHEVWVDNTTLVATCASRQRAEMLVDLLEGAFYARMHLVRCDDKEEDVAELGAHALRKLGDAFVSLGAGYEKGSL